MSEKWPIDREQWISKYDPSIDRDYIINKKRKGIQKDNHCKLTYELASRWFSKTRNAIDIGCRDGEFTHYLQYTFDRIFSFEYRWDYDWKANFATNCSNERVTLFWQGLSDREEEVTSSGTGILSRPSGREKVCRLLPLDSFDFDDVDLIKIDTDGYEMKIVQGAINTIKRCWPMLIIEQGYFDQKEAMEFCIDELGYTHVATCDRGLDHILIKEQRNDI